MRGLKASIDLLKSVIEPGRSLALQDEQLSRPSCCRRVQPYKNGSKLGIDAYGGHMSKDIHLKLFFVQKQHL